MYDHFNDLTDNRDFVRDAKTSYYWLGNVPEHFKESFVTPSYDRRKSFTFYNEFGTDEFYLIDTKNPIISVHNKRLPAPERGWNVKPPNGLFDVVFISNGEPTEEKFYAQLEARNLGDRLHWVKGVNGRNQAYKEAARVSRTHHFFAVFAKLELDPTLDLNVPIHTWDRTHYVFNALNPVNGLCYGHQAMILYDREQVLLNPGDKIDFTMSQLYAPIKKTCGVAHYNTDPLIAWRTAFREVLKLCLNQSRYTEGYVDKWLTGEGAFSEYSIQGAKDAIEFFKEVQGDPSLLQQSYEWAWLATRFKGAMGTN